MQALDVRRACGFVQHFSGVIDHADARRFQADIQTSPIYPGGLALRFARVKRYRTDKRASEADTIATVRDIYRQTTGLDAPTGR